MFPKKGWTISLIITFQIFWRWYDLVLLHENMFLSYPGSHDDMTTKQTLLMTTVRGEWSFEWSFRWFSSELGVSWHPGVDNCCEVRILTNDNMLILHILWIIQCRCQALWILCWSAYLVAFSFFNRCHCSYHILFLSQLQTLSTPPYYEQICLFRADTSYK